MSVHYPPQDPVSTGLKGRCPRCGEGRLFHGLLTVRDRCSACDLDFAFEDSGDGPTVFIIMGLGFVVLGAALWTELTFAPAWWLHVILWPPLIVALGLPALRMVKGVLIALTWHHDAAQGRLDPGDGEAK
ncbi:MAG: DUF983 domain-containing protein [Pseudomonadota bacterium]